MSNEKKEPYLTLNIDNQNVQVFEDQLSQEPTEVTVNINTKNLADVIGWAANIKCKLEADLENVTALRAAQRLQEFNQGLQFLLDSNIPVLKEAISSPKATLKPKIITKEDK
tara:strand:+ start:1692 stop:2027 length:336 start_codon:yes stop_codon:yes gene_type:complete